MADIELVIKIPKETVNAIKDNVMFTAIPSEILWDVTSAIVNGTPLPKGHGRILDEKDILDTKNNDGCLYDLYDMPDYIAGVKAIIKADTEGEE